MKQYICLSHTPWQSVPTRTQQLMTRLKEAQVLFFEPPAAAGNKDYKKPGRRVRPGLMVYTLPPVLDVEERHSVLFRRNLNRITRFIEGKLLRHRFREPVLWCTSPHLMHLLDYLPYRGLVYDCDRDWPEYPIRWESDLALAADVIFAASPGLVEHLAPCNGNIALLPNGVNYPMFCQEDPPCPTALLNADRPLFGWVGTIHPALDLTPALYAAQAMPDYGFVFVGERQENPIADALERLHNVAFLGPKPVTEIPDFLARFDVCMNFLRKDDLLSDVLPSRIFEYLSSGKPLVSMLYRDQVEQFPDVVYSAHSNEEFAALCRNALSEAGFWVKNRRREYGAAAAWSVRAAEVERILESIGLY